MIMAVDGAAVGAGLSLVLNGDVVLASPKARFGAGFLRVGLMPDMGGIYNLVRRLGSAKACELAFMGELFGAEAAAHMGLVNKVVDPDLLLTETAD